MKRCMVIIMLLCNAIVYGQAKRIEYRFKNKENATEYISNIITIGNDGIIQNFKIHGKEYINVNENTITYSYEGAYKDIIVYTVSYKMENDLLIFELKNSPALEVRINPEPGVIYSTDKIRLIKYSEKYIEEVFTGHGDDKMAFTYRYNTVFTDYRWKDNIQSKLEFRRNNGSVQGCALRRHLFKYDTDGRGQWT